MKFDKQVLFLGATVNELPDGGVYYTVQLFEPSIGSAVSVNVAKLKSGANAELLEILLGAKFGDSLMVTFFLRQMDKLYKLCIDHVSF